VVALARVGGAEALAYLKSLEARSDLSDYVKRYLKTAITIGERKGGEKK